MKRSILLLLLCMFSSVVYSQEEQPKHLFSLTLPNGTVRINKHEFASVKGDKFMLKHIGWADSIYRNGNVIMSYLYGKDSKLFSRSMERIRQEDIFLGSKNSNLQIVVSEIVTVNSQPFVVSEYKNGDYRMLSFVTDYDKDFEHMYGFIQYRTVDE